MAEIKKQKRKVITSLSPYKGAKQVKVAKLEEKDISNYLSVVEKKEKVFSLVSQDEINRLKRQNYGDYYLTPQ